MCKAINYSVREEQRFAKKVAVERIIDEKCLDSDGSNWHEWNDSSVVNGMVIEDLSKAFCLSEKDNNVEIWSLERGKFWNLTLRLRTEGLQSVHVCITLKHLDSLLTIRRTRKIVSKSFL